MYATPTVFFSGTAPHKGSDGAAAYDLRSAHAATLEPGDRMLVQTGLKLSIPRGYMGMICPRSGLALKHGVTVLNAPGIIDADYRGDVGVILANFGREPFAVAEGDRIAQLVIAPAYSSGWLSVSELDATERGDLGFGSTGVA